MKNEECTCDVRSVPYAVLELEDRKHKRLWVVILVLIVALLGTNAGWIYYENQFQDVVTTTENVNVDSADGGNAVGFIGSDNEVNYGEGNSDKDNN